MCVCVCVIDALYSKGETNTAYFPWCRLSSAPLCLCFSLTPQAYKVTQTSWTPTHAHTYTHNKSVCVSQCEFGKHGPAYGWCYQEAFGGWLFPHAAPVLPASSNKNNLQVKFVAVVLLHLWSVCRSLSLSLCLLLNLLCCLPASFPSFTSSLSLSLSSIQHDSTSFFSPSFLLPRCPLCGNASLFFVMELRVPENRDVNCLTLGRRKKKKQFLLNKAALQNLGCFRKNENKMCAGVVSWKCRNYRQKNASCCCLPHESSPGLARGWETLLSQISSQQQRLKSVSMADYCFTSCCMLQLKKQCRITAIGSI